ncbi:PAS domain S-box protein [Roseovarius sp. 217]|uniref:PAS domain S-box protein n=1 Tax=Roseovarius sp. (strain 217) TaxID=314264 RepID=UPI00006855AF|nr:PAS domain S-box protein [Roseovarius sp. 217]EAQ24872.1 Multi-sensor Signal Transduction Histidine Kinase [Roseovarius sp. 217]
MTKDGRLHPDDLETALEPIRLCLEGISELASSEYRLRSRDGSQWRWMKTDAAIASRDGVGKVVSVIGALTDITERKTTENALRRSVEQFRSAFNNATVGEAIVDLNGDWLAVNPALCKLFGYSADELLRTNFQTLTHPDDLNRDLFNLDLLKSGSIPVYQTEKRYIRANGAIMWGLLSVGIVRDAEGQPDHFISQIVDVTEQRRLSELRNDFVANVSHELRTPLTSVLGSLTLLSAMNEEPFSDEA